MTGLLAMIYSLARTREQANVISPVVLLVFAMLGGSMFPYESLPGFLQMLGQCTPNRWAVLALAGRSAVQASGRTGRAASRAWSGWARLGSRLAFFLFKRQLADGGRR